MLRTGKVQVTLSRAREKIEQELDFDTRRVPQKVAVIAFAAIAEKSVGARGAFRSIARLGPSVRMQDTRNIRPCEGLASCSRILLIG